MKIQLATANDTPYILKLIEQLQLQPNFSIAQFNWSTLTLSEELAVAQTYVVDIEARIAAFLCFRESGDTIDITVLATSPDNQRQGLQSLLLQKLIELAASLNKKIMLEVHSNNFSAISLYKRNGFKELVRRKSYYRDGADALVMVCG